MSNTYIVLIVIDAILFIGLTYLYFRMRKLKATTTMNFALKGMLITSAIALGLLYLILK